MNITGATAESLYMPNRVLACNVAHLPSPCGTLDFTDVVAFLGAFGGGCP